MRHLTLSIAFLLASFTMLYAQQDNSGGSGHNSHNSSVRGCLGGAAGNYTLTSGDTTYELVGNEELLSKLTGKEVKITGPKGSATDIPPGMAGQTGEATSNPTAGAAPTIKVMVATIISDHCGK
jgi:hypothetical protein